jgi:hypothetical protein
MSRRLISLNSDLARLQAEGFDLDILNGYLLVRDVPYVGSGAQVKRGTLVSNLELAGDRTVQPQDHTMKFIGDFPCDQHGRPLEMLRHQNGADLGGGLVVNFSFSRKRTDKAPYTDYHEKVTTYVAQLEGHAQALDPSATARTHPVIVPDAGDSSVFNYLETASSRAGIVAASDKLRLSSVAIVGLGGTGSYVLDQVAKTPVGSIHLFDHDVFLTHNAFRGPGAPSLEELQAKSTKVSYWQQMYSKMHRGIVPHPYRIDSTTVGELQGMTFVFVCIDGGGAKRLIVDALEQYRIPFIDVGMGIELRQNNSLAGILRATLSEPERRDSFRSRVSMADPGEDAEYDDNIQVADLNAFNALLAVLRWKMFYKFYDDFQDGLQLTFTTDTSMLLVEDCR